MTHTYSHGCFKLIFRKCLPKHTPYPPCRKHTQRHTYTYVLYRDCPPSRVFRIVERYNISTLFLLFAVFSGLGYFFFLFSFLFFLFIFFDFLLFCPFSRSSLHPFSSLCLHFSRPFFLFLFFNSYMFLFLLTFLQILFLGTFFLISISFFFYFLFFSFFFLISL